MAVVILHVFTTFVILHALPYTCYIADVTLYIHLTLYILFYTCYTAFVALPVLHVLHYILHSAYLM